MKQSSVLALITSSILFLGSCSFLTTSLPGPTTTKQRIDSFPNSAIPLEKPAKIYWDDHQIPYIEAGTDSDLAFLLGMVQAHLRLGQMELVRRISQGRLSESIGPIPQLIDLDYTIRILDYGKAVPEIRKNLPESTSAWLEKFTSGINFYVAQMKEKPHELKVLGIDLEPWTVEDVLTTGRLVGSDPNWISYFQYLRLQNTEGLAQWESDLLRLNQNSLQSFSPSTPPSLLSSIVMDFSRSGSNAMVLSPEKTKTKEAIVAGDPHLGISLPNFWILVGIQSPSYHAIGFMLPTLPFLAIGRNEHIGWGGTNMRSASSELYDVSELRQSEFEEKEITIPVRYYPDITRKVRSCSAGVVISDSPLLQSQSDKVYALRWLGHENSDEIGAFLQLNRAHNWSEFRQALKSYSVSGQNLLYGDSQGNIGEVMAVHLPERNWKHWDHLAKDYSNPKTHWGRILDGTELPYSFNPEEGFLASANNLPTNATVPVGFVFSNNDRIKRLQTLLGSKQWDWSELLQLQTDTHSEAAFQLVQSWKPYLDKIKPKNQKETNFLSELLAWRGNYDTDSKGALNFQLMLYHLVQAISEKDGDDPIVESLYRSEHIVSWVQGSMSKLRPQKRIGILRQVVVESLEESEDWKNWGDMHRIRIGHIFASIPLLGGKYVLSDSPAPGSSTTLYKRAHSVKNEKIYTTYGSQARHIFRMSDPNENYVVLFGGQDGWLNFDNFNDQYQMWKKGEYIRFPLEVSEIQKSFPFVTELGPDKVSR